MRIILLLLLLMGIGWGSPKPHPIQHITLGIQVSPAMTLVMVAKDKGFFRKEGLDVELKQFTAGKFALQAFLSRSIDYAVSGEVPVCLAALQGNEIRVVTQVVETTRNEVRMVVFKDATSFNPVSYFKAKHRKLSTSFGGGPEFFTYDFLRYYHLGKENVEILSQNPEDMPAALATHSVDAIAVFDPFAFMAEKRLGEKTTTFIDPSGYSELYVLAARPDQVTMTPRTIEAMLRALQEASVFAAQHSDAAKQVLQAYTKLDRNIIDGIWKNFSFKLALNRKLIQYWNAEAEWAKATDKVSFDTPIPNFKNMIETQFLKKVNPKAVNL